VPSSGLSIQLTVSGGEYLAIGLDVQWQQQPPAGQFTTLEDARYTAEEIDQAVTRMARHAERQEIEAVRSRADRLREFMITGSEEDKEILLSGTKSIGELVRDDTRALLQHQPHKCSLGRRSCQLVHGRWSPLLPPLVALLVIALWVLGVWVS
jgi:hypothetical protein